VQAQLEALRASATEGFVAGYCQMAAFTAGKSPVPSGRHCLKLIARHAVRTPNRDQGHNYIHPHTFFALSFAAANILSVDDYRSVKKSAVARLCCDLPHPCHLQLFSREYSIGEQFLGRAVRESALDLMSQGAFRMRASKDPRRLFWSGVVDSAPWGRDAHDK
jgi:hypothetical protein